MRFRRSSTLIRWEKDTLSHENGGFRKRLPSWRLSKTDAFRISVDGRKRFENASVDADICIRFRWIQSGGIRKRISVDVASVKLPNHI